MNKEPEHKTKTHHAEPEPAEAKAEHKAAEPKLEPVAAPAPEPYKEPPVVQLARILRTLRGSEEGIRLSAVPDDFACFQSVLEALQAAAVSGGKSLVWPMKEPKE